MGGPFPHGCDQNVSPSFAPGSPILRAHRSDASCSFMGVCLSSVVRPTAKRALRKPIFSQFFRTRKILQVRGYRGVRTDGAAGRIAHELLLIVAWTARGRRIAVRGHPPSLPASCAHILTKKCDGCNH